MKIITQFQSIESFTTERLVAKKINFNDLKKIIGMNADPRVMAKLGGVREVAESKQDFECHLRRWNEDGFGSWMFYLKDTDQWVGRAGLRRLLVAGKDEVEISHALLPQFWNQGLATEMAKACVEIAFEVIRLNNIVCFAEKDHVASQEVMKKIGFQYERDFEYQGVHHRLYRLRNPRKVEILPYNPQWSDSFDEESFHLQKTLGNHLKEIYHIGSTSIPQMPAKPVIDSMLVCENLDEIDIIARKLTRLKYINMRRSVIPHRSFFIRRQDEEIAFHLHIRERGDPQINRHVNFRDYCMHHADDARRYSELKIKLAQKFPEDISSYVLGKDQLVQEIDAKAKLWSGRKIDYLPPNTGPFARDWSKEKLVKAMEANLNVQMTHFAQYLNQVTLIRIPGYSIVNTELPDDTFNYVLEADFSSREATQKIGEVTGYFLKKKNNFSWWICPNDKPDDLSVCLVNNGYVLIETHTAMHFDLDACIGHISMPHDLKIIQAIDKSTLQDFALVSTKDEASFKKYFQWIASVLINDDPIIFFVGYVDSKPVVRAMSCYFAQVAGLYWLSVAPSASNKGYDKAMLQYQLYHAKERGYHIAILQASHDEYSLYKNFGFKEHGLIKKFKLAK